MNFLFHCLKIQVTGKPSKKPGDFYQSKMKDSRQNSLIHWFFRLQTQGQRGKLIKWQKRLSLGTGGCTVMFLQPSNRQMALIHWEAAIIEEELKIMAKPALRPVGLRSSSSLWLLVITMASGMGQWSVGFVLETVPSAGYSIHIQNYFESRMWETNFFMGRDKLQKLL